MQNKIKYIIRVFTSLSFLLSAVPVWAAGPPEPSPFSNPLAVTLLVLMLLLLIIIGVLANILLGTADIKAEKRKEDKGKKIITSVVLIFLLLASSTLFAQDAITKAETTKKAVTSIGGMPAATFYIMATIIFLELSVIIALLVNIKFLIWVEKEKTAEESASEVETVKAGKNKLSWWARFNKFKPISQEADLDLGHDYDGIRELDNRLPPWWLYGFYLTIIVSVIYLWRFHVSHDGPSSKEEYESSVARAEIKIQDYLKSKGEAVDENSVTLLTAPEDIAKGKAIFIKSCAVCHKEDGGGLVGPNLTDDYWLHGNDVKSIFKTIRYGINAMPPWQNTYSNKEIAAVSSYVKTLHGTNPPAAKPKEGVLQKEEATPATPATDSAAKENKVVMNQ